MTTKSEVDSVSIYPTEATKPAHAMAMLPAKDLFLL